MVTIDRRNKRTRSTPPAFEHAIIFKLSRPLIGSFGYRQKHFAFTPGKHPRHPAVWPSTQRESCAEASEGHPGILLLHLVLPLIATGDTSLSMESAILPDDIEEPITSRLPTARRTAKDFLHPLLGSTPAEKRRKMPSKVPLDGGFRGGSRDAAKIDK
jgi:hypothetical protein